MGLFDLFKKKSSAPTVAAGDKVIKTRNAVIIDHTGNLEAQVCIATFDI